MNPLRTLAFTCIAILLFTARSANAQLSVYGSVSASNYGYDQYTDGDVYYNGDKGGFGGGAYYNFNQRAVKVGLDVRDTYTPGSYGGNNGAVYIRLGFVPDNHPCHPYFEIGPGWISTKTSTDYYYYYYSTTGSIHSVAISEAFGLDIRVSHHVSIRAVDFEDTIGGSNSNHSEAFSIGAGVVIHLGHTR